MWRTIIFGILSALVVSPVLAKDGTRVQVPIDALNREWTSAFDRQDLAALMVMYAEEAYLVPAGGGFVRGTDEIRNFWRQQMQEFKSASMNNVALKLLSDSTAIAVGTLRFETRGQQLADGKSSPLKVFVGDYMTVWERMRGQWKLAADSWSATEEIK
jgi:ketosteroid isomerase-like protein